MKLFRFKTTVSSKGLHRTPSHFTDWYEAYTEAEARELHNEDLHRYDLPLDGVTTEVTECNTETLKPV